MKNFLKITLPILIGIVSLSWLVYLRIDDVRQVGIQLMSYFEFIFFGVWIFLSALFIGEFQESYSRLYKLGARVSIWLWMYGAVGALWVTSLLIVSSYRSIPISLVLAANVSACLLAPLGIKFLVPKYEKILGGRDPS